MNICVSLDGSPEPVQSVLRNWIVVLGAFPEVELASGSRPCIVPKVKFLASGFVCHQDLYCQQTASLIILPQSSEPGHSGEMCIRWRLLNPNDYSIIPAARSCVRARNSGCASSFAVDLPVYPSKIRSSDKEQFHSELREGRCRNYRVGSSGLVFSQPSLLPKPLPKAARRGRSRARFKIPAALSWPMPKFASPTRTPECWNAV